MKRLTRTQPSFEACTPLLADHAKLSWSNFFVRLNGKFMATPLMLVLLVVESTDIVFAIDSIPAIFAITRDPFIVFTSNVCAILGLRALYFLLEGMIRLFRYLDEGLAVILVFIGIKMLVSEFTKSRHGSLWASWLQFWQSRLLYP
jgi:tellurite resistance protein TerC